VPTIIRGGGKGRKGNKGGGKAVYTYYSQEPKLRATNWREVRRGKGRKREKRGRRKSAVFLYHVIRGRCLLLDVKERRKRREKKRKKFRRTHSHDLTLAKFMNIVRERRKKVEKGEKRKEKRKKDLAVDVPPRSGRRRHYQVPSAVSKKEEERKGKKERKKIEKAAIAAALSLSSNTHIEWRMPTRVEKKKGEKRGEKKKGACSSTPSHYKIARCTSKRQMDVGGKREEKKATTCFWRDQPHQYYRHPDT